MSRRERLRIAALSVLPLLPAVALYGALAACGVVPWGVLLALAVASVAGAAFRYVRITRRIAAAGNRAGRGGADAW
jgi:hypothetical protein